MPPLTPGSALQSYEKRASVCVFLSASWPVLMVIAGKLGEHTALTLDLGHPNLFFFSSSLFHLAWGFTASPGGS